MPHDLLKPMDPPAKPAPAAIVTAPPVQKPDFVKPTTPEVLARFGVVKPTDLPRAAARNATRVTYPTRIGNLGVLLKRAGVKGRRA